MMASPLPSPDRDWGDLLRRCAAKDESALADLYQRASAAVHGLALQICRDAQAAEDVTLDVFQQVWRDAGVFDPTRGSPLGWILMLTRSRALDRRRRVAKYAHDESLDAVADIADDDAAPHDMSWFSEARRLVQDALKRISADEREAIGYAFFDGLSHSEIARKLSQPLGTVKTRIRSGLAKLRVVLEPRVCTE
ncbi:MAG: sigma-70 family RNA polymerase sigma factor [Planctomycetes bacterium]|nr:sigma-70 family RNA polymerase sigma factor [Planctomycetota bacterium]